MGPIQYNGMKDAHSGLILTTWRKFRVTRPLRERSQLKSLARGKVGGRVQVRFAENNHPDVCVEVYFTSFGACKPKIGIKMVNRKRFKTPELFYNCYKNIYFKRNQLYFYLKAGASGTPT